MKEKTNIKSNCVNKTFPFSSFLVLRQTLAKFKNIQEELLTFYDLEWKKYRTLSNTDVQNGKSKDKKIWLQIHLRHNGLCLKLPTKWCKESLKSWWILKEVFIFFTTKKASWITSFLYVHYKNSHLLLHMELQYLEEILVNPNIH